MSNKIFYFTGTGNAYSIAKSLAASLGDADLVPMAKALQSPDIGEAERIGLIFPVYGWGMPRMAAEFARNLKPTSDQYVFAAATSGGTPGKTLPQLHKILRGHGSKLDAGFAVTGDFLISLDTANDMAIITFMNWLGRKSKPAAMSERLPEIARAVAAKESRKPESSNASVNLIGGMLYGLSIRFFQTMDKSYAVSDACVSCGTCAKVCPRENVTLEAGVPTWHQNCEMCYACMVWCPKKAISFGGGVPKEPSHHADIALGDALLR